MCISYFVAALISALLFGGTAMAQGKPDDRDATPRPVAAAEDPVNRKVTASTIDGLVVAVTIDGATIRLDSATPARVSKGAARGRNGDGDRVTAVGFAGGNRVSETTVPDALLNAEEGGGLVRVAKRQVMLTLAAPRAIDTVEVRAPATGATARLDVRAAYAPYSSYCKGETPNPKFCPSAANPDRP